MGKSDKFVEKKEPAYKRDLKNVETRSGKKEPHSVFSFEYFDRNQGQTFEEWEEDKLLALAINRLMHISKLTQADATRQQIIKPYPKVDFPINTAFTHPKHILPDVVWCSMHIQGKECVIGYFEDNIFYIVFLDKNHEFWISKKKNT